MFDAIHQTVMLLEIASLYIYFPKFQACILPPDIGQSPIKNQVMPNESFTTGMKLKIFFISYRRLKTHKLSKQAFPTLVFPFMNILIYNLCSSFFFIIQIRIMCLSKSFYTNTLLFFAVLGSAFPLKTFYMSLHSTKNLKKM